MSRRTSTLTGLSLAACLTLLPAVANAWWACPSDREIQLRNNNTQVRCFRETAYRSPDACPMATAGGIAVGTGLRRDFSGNRDKCVGQVNGVNVVVVDPTCNGGGPGYSLQRRSNPNPDRCRRGSSESAPTVNVP
jgi:hypothetical protein